MGCRCKEKKTAQPVSVKVTESGVVKEVEVVKTPEQTLNEVVDKLNEIITPH